MKLEAIEILLSCDPNTIIDGEWWDYFRDDPTYYNAMVCLTGLKSYQQILDRYEGFYIRDFLCNVLNFEYQIK